MLQLSMELSKLIKTLNYNLLCGDENSNAIVKNGYTSDLLSDVMANMDDESALITIQAHQNTIAVAGLKNAPLIIFCNNRPIETDVIEAATKQGITILSTQDNQFMASVKLSNALKQDF